ncbi:MAG: hypothetical protein PHF63_07095 [Herbinix sp.]|nr:hypothetical protein [Herbinix sp.]
MKRKPILFNKLEASRLGLGREVIGLIGTHHGAGVTHTGLMLAFYMGEVLGKKTAYLECNEHHDMIRIQKAYEWSREDEFSFSFHLITCYSEVTPRRISEIFGEDYECIILDFGIDFTTNRDEFLRCSTKIVVGGRSEWDQQKLVQFSEVTEAIRGSDSWLYFIPQVNDKTITKIKNEVTRRVWRVPLAEEPTIPSRDTNRFFSRIF